ncbi:MAG: excinuclease ABC subunit UvrC [Candidatus Desulfofervidus auxilii]|nr:excinuclease ABC subunit UvrC [Candidatus Desulfofervidus auxilii]
MELEKSVEQLPHQPGVYLIKDKRGHIIYVGKAKDLQKRVKSYFSRQTSAKVKSMLSQAVQIDYIITPSEKEALILECNLIKTHKPRYNVVLRDDKNYPYLRIDLNEKWPRFVIVRRMQKDGAKYFGPFASAKAVRETLKSMSQLFPLRRCSDFVLMHRKRPCLNYQIGRCVAPCVGYVTEEEYKKLAFQACLFLEGQADGLLETLENEMKKASANLEFERAAFYRDRIFAIKRTLEKQAMVSSDFVNQDIMGYLSWPEKEKKIEVIVLQVRNGYLLGERNYTLSLSMASPKEAFKRFLEQYYYRQDFIPSEIIIPFLPEEKKVWEEWLSEKANGKVNITTPQTEEHKRLLTMAIENLKHHLNTKLMEKSVLFTLKSILNLPQIPKRIECFDISNIQGQFAVASMVVFIDGEPAKDEYRRFKLKQEGFPNDYAMMEEVLSRRFSKNETLPDLLLIDGGKGQLKIAIEVLKKNGLNISVAAIAKGREGEEDKIYLPERKNPLMLKSYSPALRFLKHIRDEAHRFAISYYKKLHRKELLDSALENIPGLGPKRRALLWQHFNSLEEIKNASLETLCKIGLPYSVAKSLKEALT